MARSKVKSRSHYDVAHLHPLTNVHTNFNFIHLAVSEIQPGQTYPAALLPAHSDTMSENNTSTSLKGCICSLGDKFEQQIVPLYVCFWHYFV